MVVAMTHASQPSNADRRFQTQSLIPVTGLSADTGANSFGSRMRLVAAGQRLESAGRKLHDGAMGVVPYGKL